MAVIARECGVAAGLRPARTATCGHVATRPTCHRPHPLPFFGDFLVILIHDVRGAPPPPSPRLLTLRLPHPSSSRSPPLSATPHPSSSQASFVPHPSPLVFPGLFRACRTCCGAAIAAKVRRRWSWRQPRDVGRGTSGLLIMCSWEEGHARTETSRVRADRNDLDRCRYSATDSGWRHPAPGGAGATGCVGYVDLDMDPREDGDIRSTRCSKCSLCRSVFTITNIHNFQNAIFPSLVVFFKC